jgi:hypothetical protein
MFRRLRQERNRRYGARDSGGDLGLAVTLVVFGILPIGVVSAMMLTQIFGG